MKNTLILCILSAMVASGITYYIMEKSVREAVKEDALAFDSMSDSLLGESHPISKEIPLEIAAEMTAALREGSDTGNRQAPEFIIPLAWTFDACDIRRILRSRFSDVKRLKIYGGIYTSNIDSKKYLTLLVAGVKSDETDIVSTSNGDPAVFEYADPCPPKCGKANAKLLPPQSCTELTIKSVERKRIDCKMDFEPVTCK